MAEERDETEIQAFFALSRRTLYTGGLIAIALLGLLLGVTALLIRIGHGRWALPAFPAAAAMTTALLMRHPAGRGCLRTVGLGQRSGRRLAPKTQFAAWLVICVVSIGLCALLP